MTAQNTSIVNAASDTTQQYFNNIFLRPATVTNNQDAAIIGFFEKQTNGNKLAAQVLASAVIYTALAQNTDPMDIISQLANLPNGQLNSYLTMFLNLNRVGTSYLGINNQPITNKYIKRAIMV
jgi:hypothetical protein